MKNTIMSLKLELMSQNATSDEIQYELCDDLEGSVVKINTPSGKVFTNECLGGCVDYLSETNGNESDEVVIVDCNERKLEWSFIESYSSLFEKGDVVEIIFDNNSIFYQVLNISNRVFLHSQLMDKTIAFGIDFTSVEELRQYLENNYSNYKVYKKI